MRRELLAGDRVERVTERIDSIAAHREPGRHLVPTVAFEMIAAGHEPGMEVES